MSQFNISPDQIVAQAVHCGFGPGGCFGPLDLSKPTDFQQHFRSAPDSESSSPADSGDSAKESQRSADEASSTQAETREAESSTSDDAENVDSNEQQGSNPSGDTVTAKAVAEDQPLIAEGGEPVAAETEAEEVSTTPADQQQAKEQPQAKDGVAQPKQVKANPGDGEALDTENATDGNTATSGREQSARKDGEQPQVESHIIVDRYPVEGEPQLEAAADPTGQDAKEKLAVPDAGSGKVAAKDGQETSEEATAEPSTTAAQTKAAKKPVANQTTKSTTNDKPDAQAEQLNQEKSPSEGEQESRGESRHEGRSNKQAERVHAAPKPGQTPPPAVIASQADASAEGRRVVNTETIESETTASPAENKAAGTDAASGARSAATKSDGAADALGVGPSAANRTATGTRETRTAERSLGRLNSAETSRFINRVARAFDFAQERGGVLKLRLSPPELGSLRLEVTLKEGAVVARLETETTAAKTVLMDNLAQLKERLAEQNIRIETFDVDVNDQSSHEGAASQQDRDREQVARTQRTEGTASSGESSDEDSPSRAQRASHSDGELDLVA